METLRYSETTDDFGGLSFTSTFNGTNVVQKSGGYTAIGPWYGFFISTSSTLLANENTEEWDFEGIGIAQEDTMTLKRTGIDLLGVNHLANGHYFTGGVRYNSVSFSRFDFDSTDKTAELNNTLFTTPSVQTQLQNELDQRLTAVNAARTGADDDPCIRDDGDGGCIGTINGSNQQEVTLAEFWELKKLEPEATQGVVFEDMTSWSALGV